MTLGTSSSEWLRWRTRVLQYKTVKAGYSNWLELLSDKGEDVFGEVWRAVFQSSVAVKIPHPLRFRNILERETRYLDDQRKSQLETSAWYVRWLTRRHARVEPVGVRMEWRITQMRHSLVLYGVNIYYYRKDELVRAAQANRIHAVKSWPKRQLWQQLLRAGARVEPRFQTYLVHWVDDDGRVVSEQRHI